ncbi:TerB family tellurite resistance protein [Phyllobacterium myrsinacearum]|uniref:Putative tellurite resistance protein B-like protein n=1 Tax=Phyllobacterium myrsinacearum TaxID=28101 RepID=A0A839EN92_9HYPH|nr:TerB family tellurite resistance protein [Phyllobacterium myrsinacearum]MBA8881551.1 putative tellurite resistance protein B-like protein [Phyllobacterium myrsinacearum]
MHIIVAILSGIASLFYLIFRLQSAARSVRELDKDTHHLRNKGKRVFEGFIGSRHGRIRDPRLAATVLMIQLVRTGAPLTNDERLKIIALVRGPMQINDPDRMFRKAWRYTTRRGSFPSIARDMMPMLRARLSVDERFQLIGMLRQAAAAYSEESELQAEMIAGLQRQLMQAG